MLLDMIGEIAENSAYTQGFWFKIQSIQSFDLGVLGFANKF